MRQPANSALVRGVLSSVTRGRTASMSHVSGVPPTSSTRVSAVISNSRAKRCMRRLRNHVFQPTEEMVAGKMLSTQRRRERRGQRREHASTAWWWNGTGVPGESVRASLGLAGGSLPHLMAKGSIHATACENLECPYSFCFTGFRLAWARTSCLRNPTSAWRGKSTRR